MRVSTISPSPSPALQRHLQERERTSLSTSILENGVQLRRDSPSLSQRIKRQWKALYRSIQRLFLVLLYGTEKLGAEDFKRLQDLESQVNTPIKPAKGATLDTNDSCLYTGSVDAEVVEELLTGFAKEKQKLADCSQTWWSMPTSYWEKTPDWQMVYRVADWKALQEEINSLHEVVQIVAKDTTRIPNQKKREGLERRAKDIMGEIDLLQKEHDQKFADYTCTMKRALEEVGNAVFQDIHTFSNVLSLTNKVTKEELEVYLSVADKLYPLYGQEEQEKKQQIEAHRHAIHLFFFSQGELVDHRFPVRLPPPRGLHNFGATCWMNTLLQNLFSRREFFSLLERPWREMDPFGEKKLLKGEEKVRTSLRNLMHCIWEKYFLPMTKKNVFSWPETNGGVGKIFQKLFPLPKETDEKTEKSLQEHLLHFFRMMKEEAGFPGLDSLTEQQDLPEMLHYFLEAMEINIKTATYREFVRPGSTQKCTTTQEVSPQRCIRLPLSKRSSTLQELMDDKFSSEDIEDTEDGVSCSNYYEEQDDGTKRFYNDELRVQKVTRHEKIVSRPPPVIPVQLMRFTNDSLKNSKPIFFPCMGDSSDDTLDLANVFFDEGNKNKEFLYHYVVTSFSIHIGKGLDSGHYTACVYRSDEKQWYYCNDEKVEPISIAEVRKHAEKAYTLFLQHIGPSTPPPQSA